MKKPTNEQGVIVAFCLGLHQSKWEFISIRTKFPDAIIRHTETDEVWKVEFEYLASNFLAHKHPLVECDLIVCWKNDYPTCPLPILALQDSDWFMRNPTKAKTVGDDIQYWIDRAHLAEGKLRLMSKQNLDTLEIPLLDDSVSPMYRVPHLKQYDSVVDEVVKELSSGKNLSLNQISNISKKMGGSNIGRKQARRILQEAISKK